MRQIQQRFIRPGMKIVQFLWLACALALGACSSSNTTSIPATPQLESDDEMAEYAVYNALLKARFVHDRVGLLVIRRNTSLDPARSSIERSDYLQQNLPGLSDEIVEDFENKNQTLHELKPQFDLGVEYTLVSDQEIEELFGQQDKDGWQAFYEKYPDAPGEITLSRVGFNEARNKALVYIGNQQGWLAGAGYFVLLTMQDGQWIIESELMAWIS